MSQEKQKVIRVLKPVQKKKSLSPVYYAVAGVSVGVALTSVLIFSFLGKDATQTQVNTQTQHEAISAQTTPQVSNDEKNVPLAPTATTTQVLDENSDESEAHNDFNQPQPKLNDISSAFKPHKEVVAQQNVVQQPKTDNPFANATGQPAAPKPAVTHQTTKPVVKAAPVVTAKTTTPAQASATAKTAVKKPVVAKPEEKALAKATPVKPAVAEKDAEVDLPKGTVQVTVTRSVKE